MSSLPAARPALDPARDDDWWAVTFWQPWAAAIILGKNPENRPLPTWQAPRRIWVHAGQHKTSADEYQAFLALSPLLSQAWADLAVCRSHLLGTVTITGCHHSRDCGSRCSPWAARASWHWELASPWRLPRPYPWREGRRGFWHIPEPARARLAAHITATTPPAPEETRP